MEKFIYKSETLAEERGKYWRDIATLEATEGFPLLPPLPQKIIRVSLLLQERAERDMDPDHKNDPWYYDWINREMERHPKYLKSLQHINRWYCHTAVAALERGNLTGERPEDCPKEFFNATYLVIAQKKELEHALNLFGYPSVVHIGIEPGNDLGENGKYHTFLALGHNSKNEIVVWEKVRIQRPYRVTTLSQVYSDYHDVPYWGIRKLR